MKKKIFTTITMLIMLVSVFASVPAVFAEEAAADTTGGLDLYSITIKYKEPILVRYYEDKIKVENEQGKKVSKEVKYFVNPEATSDADKYMDGDDSLLSDSLVVPAGIRSGGNFYQVSTDDGTIKTGLQYSKIPYNNAFITHIIDSSAVTTTSKVDLLGITAPYDDNPYVNQNPNVEYADDGYALAVEKDENGNQYKIDRNGYLIDTNDCIWRTADDDRIELFISVPVLRKTGTYKGKKPEVQIVESDEMVWVPYADRFDPDNGGKVKDIQSISYWYVLTDDEYDNFLADESQTSISMHLASSLDEYKAAPNKAKTIVYAQTLRMNKELDPDTYFNTDRTFTANDILKDENGIIAMGTPRIGTPVIKAKIESITLEIDAAGTQLYDNVADDPQQKNTITLSVGATKQDAELYKKWYDDKLCTEETYNSLMSFVVGTAKSVTTKTEVTTTKGDYKGASEYGYSPTVKSVTLEASEDALSRIPASASLYLSFHIEENQPADLINEDYVKKVYYVDKSGATSLLSQRVKLRTDTEADQKAVLGKGLLKAVSDTGTETSGIPTWAIIVIIAGGVVVVAAIVIIVVVSSKKKKK